MNRSRERKSQSKLMEITRNHKGHRNKTGTPVNLEPNRRVFWFPQAYSVSPKLSRLFCLPRGWSGAGVGVGMLRVLGIPLLDNDWLLGFLIDGFLVSRSFGILVSWFLGFLISWFLGLLVSWFLCFKVSQIKSFKVQRFEDST